MVTAFTVIAIFKLFIIATIAVINFNIVVINLNHFNRFTPQLNSLSFLNLQVTILPIFHFFPIISITT